jgi:SAM-dependent methyltransferase
MYSDEGVLRVSGWMLNPRSRVTSVDTALNGELISTEAPQVRVDVAAAFPWIPHAGQSGFRVALPNARSGDRLEVLGRRGRCVVTEMKSAVRVDLESTVPTPSPALMRRVAGGANARGFKADGLRHFTSFVDAVRRHRPLQAAGRMLDWGCGCGRISIHFLLDRTVPECFGCDIDREAIAWCQSTLPGGTFQPVDPYPPTSYPNQFFDLVIAYSVFTHLNRETQNMWLAEMRRVIAPRGLFLASIHGRFAAQFAFPPRGSGFIQRLRHRIGVPLLLASGFRDVPDHALDGIAPQGYYRGAFQTREYTLREWSNYFEILELVEGGMTYQDLVVMRRLD